MSKNAKRALFVVFILQFVALCSLGAKEKLGRTYQIPLPPRPDFSAIDWLVGEWEGRTRGRGPERKIHLSVAFTLDKRFIVFHEEITAGLKNRGSDSAEHWMGILSGGHTDTSFTLEAFSSTGFITRYHVTVEDAEIHFNPEGGDQPPPGWLFRRLIQRSNVGELSETVQAAPPNRPFFDLYAAKLMRVSPPSATELNPAPPPSNR